MSRVVWPLILEEAVGGSGCDQMSFKFESFSWRGGDGKDNTCGLWFVLWVLRKFGAADFPTRFGLHLVNKLGVFQVETCEFDSFVVFCVRFDQKSKNKQTLRFACLQILLGQNQNQGRQRGGQWLEMGYLSSTQEHQSSANHKSWREREVTALTEGFHLVSLCCTSAVLSPHLSPKTYCFLSIALRWKEQKLHHKNKNKNKNNKKWFGKNEEGFDDLCFFCVLWLVGLGWLSFCTPETSRFGKEPLLWVKKLLHFVSRSQASRRQHKQLTQTKSPPHPVFFCQFPGQSVRHNCQEQVLKPLFSCPQLFSFGCSKTPHSSFYLTPFERFQTKKTKKQNKKLSPINKQSGASTSCCKTTSKQKTMTTNTKTMTTNTKTMTTNTKTMTTNTKNNDHKHKTMTTNTKQWPQTQNNDHKHKTMTTNTKQWPQTQNNDHKHKTMTTNTKQWPQTQKQWPQTPKQTKTNHTLVHSCSIFGHFNTTTPKKRRTKSVCFCCCCVSFGSRFRKENEHEFVFLQTPKSSWSPNLLGERLPHIPSTFRQSFLYSNLFVAKPSLTGKWNPVDCFGSFGCGKSSRSSGRNVPPVFPISSQQHPMNKWINEVMKTFVGFFFFVTHNQTIHNKQQTTTTTNNKQQQTTTNNEQQQTTNNNNKQQTRTTTNNNKHEQQQTRTTTNNNKHEQQTTINTKNNKQTTTNNSHLQQTTLISNKQLSPPTNNSHLQQTTLCTKKNSHLKHTTLISNNQLSFLPNNTLHKKEVLTRLRFFFFFAFFILWRPKKEKGEISFTNQHDLLWRSNRKPTKQMIHFCLFFVSIFLCQNKTKRCFTQQQTQEKYTLFFFLCDWMKFWVSFSFVCWVKVVLELSICWPKQRRQKKHWHSTSWKTKTQKKLNHLHLCVCSAVLVVINNKNSLKS